MKEFKKISAQGASCSGLNKNIAVSLTFLIQLSYHVAPRGLNMILAIL